MNIRCRGKALADGVRIADDPPMLIRRERPSDVTAIHDITVAAFARPTEAGLVAALRGDPGWIPELSLVAQDQASGQVTGHVVCTRGYVGAVPALGLGPLSVHPAHQRTGIGSALVHTVLGAADALGEPLVALLGDPAYYGRFGFGPAAALGVSAPDPRWGAHFQARTLASYRGLAGAFSYAAPFEGL